MIKLFKDMELQFLEKDIATALKVKLLSGGCKEDRAKLIIKKHPYSESAIQWATTQTLLNMQKVQPIYIVHKGLS